MSKAAVAGGYVNRPTSGANFLDSTNALATDTHSSQQFSIDIGRLYDTVSRFERGPLSLGPFAHMRNLTGRGSKHDGFVASGEKVPS